MAEQSKTVDAALNLLAALGNDGSESTTADLARRLGLSRTATARLLSTLAAHDLATRSQAGWRLGPGLLGLARNVSTERAAIDEAQAEEAGQPDHAGQHDHAGQPDEADEADQVVVSAPIVDDHGTPIASLSMIAPHPLALRPHTDVAATVQAAARTISAELSANGGGHAPLPTGR